MRRGERQRKRGTTTGGETETDSYRFTSGTRSGACARHELGIVGNNGGVSKLWEYPRSNQCVQRGDSSGFGRVLTLGASWESAVRRLFQHGTPGTSHVDPDVPPGRNCAVVRRVASALRLRLRELQPDPNGSLRRDRSRRPWPATASDTLGSVWSPSTRATARSA